jgi:hypothetical protein
MPDETTRQTDLTPSATTNTKAIASLAIRVTGRTSTGSNGTTMIYDAHVRNVGRITTTKPQTSK